MLLYVQSTVNTVTTVKPEDHTAKTRWNSTLESNGTSMGLGPVADLLNGPFQATVVLFLIIAAAVLNGLIIANIRRHQLKCRTPSFVIIEYLCVADIVGAVSTLPFPLAVAIMSGRWEMGSCLCTVNAVLNVALWLQHSILVLMLKADRTAASCMPTGRYPVFSICVTHVSVVVSWLFSFSLGTAVSVGCGATFTTALLLCTPALPSQVYITVFAFYSMVMASVLLGYVVIIVYLKNRQRRIDIAGSIQIHDFRRHEQSACASLTVTVTHVLLYVPTMIVLGMPQIHAPPSVLAIFGVIFYADYILQPILLLVTSKRMRSEILDSIRAFFKVKLEFL